MYENFVFPYGHSKTIRYYEAFNLPIPINNDDAAIKIIVDKVKSL